MKDIGKITNLREKVFIYIKVIYCVGRLVHANGDVFEGE
jgi:hypothetical protein